MIALRIKCKCGKLLGVPPGLTGKKVVCPACRRAYRVPEGPSAAPPARSTSTSAKSAQPAPRIELEIPASNPLASPSELNLLEGIESSGTIIELQAPPPKPTMTEPVSSSEGGKVCPACGKTWPKSAKLCVQCGVDLRTGRSIIMTDDSGTDDAYVRAESTLKWLSFVIWTGIFPIASEAFGTRSPIVIRTIAVITILTSVCFWVFTVGAGDGGAPGKNLLLWCGDAQPTGETLSMHYLLSEYGDHDAFQAKVHELTIVKTKKANDDKDASSDPSSAKKGERRNPDVEEETEEIDIEQAVDEASDETLVAAHNSLSPEQQCFGQFHAYQLLTSAFLHDDLFHLVGNLLFLMVLGSRVNALIGTIATLILYPILAVGSAIIYMISSQHEQPHACLGASGAIMGLAGMYLVFFPVHKVHMAFWLRLGLIFRFRLYLKLFAVRGFWVVLFYIASDVLSTVLGSDDGVAHWAHLGGFIVGVVIALLLLVMRMVNARGGDLFTAILGRHAWALVGKPR